MNTPSTLDASGIKRPSLITCFRTGFDTIANHIELLLFPLVLDLVLWLGPHLTIKSLVEQGIQALDQVVQEQGSLPTDVITASQQTWQYFAEHYNLLGLLRSLPVGIPSLMASRLPIETPFGAPRFLELTGFSKILPFGLLIMLLGLAAGALYFSLVAHVSATNEVNWAQVLRKWPLATLRSMGLLLVLVVVLIGVTIPFACLLGSLTLSGLALSQIGSLVYGVVLAWWIFPLLFSAHGFFLYQEKLGYSIRRSIHLTRLTFPITGTLLVMLFLFSEGMDILWNTPQDASWLMLLGVAGHAFVATALLATSFVYYHAMNRWLQAQRMASLTPPNLGASV